MQTLNGRRVHQAVSATHEHCCQRPADTFDRRSVSTGPTSQTQRTKRIHRTTSTYSSGICLTRSTTKSFFKHSLPLALSLKLVLCGT